jgi:alkanesulfonate monooxygenase SsuD/methylene tetrahydromethanopterin reductase-like flavin-dependent oxidoreductase (luciferase family)
MVTIARKAEEVGLDVFATGEHHNPPFVPRARRRCSATSPRRPNGSSSRLDDR